MVPQGTDQPALETRMNLVSRQILLLLGERGELDLAGLGSTLHVPDPLAHVSVGWLVRSRVAELYEDSAGKLQVRMRRPFE